MSLLSVQSLTYKYPNATVPVFSDLNFVIPRQCKTAIIGPNGSGKTTLMGIISGRLTEFSGTVNRQFHIVAELSQNLELKTFVNQKDYELSEYTVEEYLVEISGKLGSVLHEISLYEDVQENKLRIKITEEQAGYLYSSFSDAGGYELLFKAERLLDEFDLTTDILKRKYNSLSGGEKTRIRLMGMLVQEPDLMLMDEPTNHLDYNTLEWLEAFLAKSRTPYLLISHDRQFLDKCADQILELKDGKINHYRGNYSFYAITKEKKLEKKVAEAEKIDKSISRLKGAANALRSDAQSMEKFKFKRSIAKNGRVCRRDDGSGSAVRTQNRQRAATVLEKRIKKMISDAEETRPFLEKKRGIKFPESHIRNRNIFTAHKIFKAYSEKCIINGLTFEVERGSCVAVTGPNGSGKTTLLRILSGLENPDKGEITRAPAASIGYYAQEFENMNANLSILEYVLDGDQKRESFSRTILGCLGLSGAKVNQVLRNASAGEKSKTAIAGLLVSAPDVLIMDEPTNHLEITAREALESALLNYNGTIILVSHDRYFINRLSDMEINLLR